MTRLLFAAIALICELGARPSWGGDVQTWNSIEPEVLSTARVNLVIQGQFRTRDDFGDFFQSRIGPVLKFRAVPRFTVIAGYYIRDNESRQGGWRVSHRPFGGMEAPIYRGKLNVSTRVLVERFIGDIVPDFTRFREYIRVSTGRKVAPYALVESFQTPRGLAIMRGQGGVRWRMSPRTSLDVSYVHDSSHRWYGPDRQAVATTLHFQLGSRHLD